MDSKRFFYDFGRALYHIDAVYNEFAKKSGVAPTLLWIMYALNDGNTHTQKEICLDWELPKSTVNTIITELRQKDFVKLEPIKGKRREMAVNLTEKGKKYAENILKEIYEKEFEVFSKLNHNDLKIIEQLDKIAEMLKDEKEK